MAKRKSAPAKTTVSVTPGNNPPVKNVLKFEDLVAHAKQGAAKQRAAKRSTGRAVRGGADRETIQTIHELATKLERALRTLRATSGDDEPSARKTAPRRRKS